MSNKKKKKNPFLIFLKVLTTIFVVFLFFIASWTSIDRISGYNYPLFGLRMSVIASESMSQVHKDNEEFLKDHTDRYYVNDLIFTKTVEKIEDLKVYDVISFLDNSNLLICHRIVEIDYEDEKIYTKGDANNVIDGVIDFKNVKGKVVYKIPQIGIINRYIASPYGILGISLTFVIIFTALILIEIDKEKERKLLESNISPLEIARINENIRITKEIIKKKYKK